MQDAAGFLQRLGKAAVRSSPHCAHHSLSRSGCRRWRSEIFSQFSHDNVNIWIRRSPDYKAVRGWVIFDFSSNATFRASFVRFAAHSVIEAPDGACGISPDGTHRSRIHLSAILAATRISISSEPTACCMSITIFSGAGQSDCRRSDRYTAGSLKGSTRAI